MKKEYIVTLKNREDLNSFYEDMETFGGTQYVPDREVELKDRRKISRNTHYLLTEEEVVELKKDDRVLDIELTPEERGLRIVRRSSYTVSGDFDKSPDAGSDINWGILHCAGNQSQRRKGSFGIDQTDQFNDTVTVFNDGENVDIVIVDEPVAYDHDEFLDPDTSQTRFIQYQWFNELDQYMVDLDTVESDSDWSNFISSNGDSNGEIPYFSCSDLSPYFPNLSHGTHVAGTAAGKTQGWARKSNIYSIAVIGFSGIGGDISALRLFDYLRAFHRNKDINATTKQRNLTVTNHSWGYSYNEVTITNLSDITSVNFRGTVYNNSGWTKSYLESNFGIYMTEDSGTYYLNIPVKVSSVDADVQDAIEEGVIVVSAAGNDNYYGVPVGHQDYDNTVTITGTGTLHYNRGGSPGSTLDAINVGSISAYSDFRRSEFIHPTNLWDVKASNFGPIVNVFAPGSNIISSVPASNTSTYQSKSGTSMASPQVAGIIACFCSEKGDVNNSKALAYIQELGIDEDMSEDLNGGGFDDITTLRDAPNLTAAAVERREEFAVISFNDFSRELDGVLYPRKRVGKKFNILAYELNATVQKDGNNVSQINENEDITLSLLSSDAPDGTRFYYTIKQDDINVDISDITVDGNPATQNDYFEISSGSSSKVFSFPQNINTVTDGSLKLELYLESSKDNRYDLKPECLIKNITEDYLITVTPTTLTEGQSINFTINETTNLASDGTVVDFEIYGFDGSQISSVTSFNNTGDNTKLITYDSVNEKWVGEFNIQSGTDYIQLTTIDDDIVVDESSVNIYMSLNNSSRGDSTSNAHIKPNITSTPPSYVDTSVPEYIISSNNSVDEDGGVLTIGITSNIRDTHTPVSFSISENGSADNISNVSGTGVTWDAGSKTGTFIVSSTTGLVDIDVEMKTDNIIFDGNSFNITFTENGSDFKLSTDPSFQQNFITKSIIVNDQTPANYLITPSAYVTSESGSAINVDVEITNAVNVSGRTVSISSNSPSDVTIPSSITISTSGGQHTGSFSIAPQDDSSVEGTEINVITLSDQVYSSSTFTFDGVNFDTGQTTIDLTLVDNDSPLYSLSTLTSNGDGTTSNENGGTVTFNISSNVLDGRTLSFSITENTDGSTGLAADNIQSVSGTGVTWDAGSKTGTFTPSQSTGLSSILVTLKSDTIIWSGNTFQFDCVEASISDTITVVHDSSVSMNLSLTPSTTSANESGGSVTFTISASNVVTDTTLNLSIVENTLEGFQADNINSFTGTGLSWNPSTNQGTTTIKTNVNRVLTAVLKTDSIYWPNNTFDFECLYSSTSQLLSETIQVNNQDALTVHFEPECQHDTNWSLFNEYTGSGSDKTNYVTYKPDLTAYKDWTAEEGYEIRIFANVNSPISQSISFSISQTFGDNVTGSQVFWSGSTGNYDSNTKSGSFGVIGRDRLTVRPVKDGNEYTGGVGSYYLMNFSLTLSGSTMTRDYTDSNGNILVSGTSSNNITVPIKIIDTEPHTFTFSNAFDILNDQKLVAGGRYSATITTNHSDSVLGFYSTATGNKILDFSPYHSTYGPSANQAYKQNVSSGSYTVTFDVPKYSTTQGDTFQSKIIFETSSEEDTFNIQGVGGNQHSTINPNTNPHTFNVVNQDFQYYRLQNLPKVGTIGSGTFYWTIGELQLIDYRGANLLTDWDSINSQYFFTYNPSPGVFNAKVYSTASGSITNIFDNNVSTAWTSQNTHIYNYFQFKLNTPQPAKTLRFYNFVPGGSAFYDWALYGTNSETAYNAAASQGQITSTYENDWSELVFGEYLDSNSNPQYGQTSWIDNDISIVV